MTRCNGARAERAEPEGLMDDDDYELEPETRDDARADDFRCRGCEANIGRRGYCGACRAEMGHDD